MILRLIRLARRLLTAILVGLTLVVVGVGVAARLAPAAGLELFAIRSGSMEPAIGVGALTVVSTTSSLAPNDVVAYRLPNDVVVTHRVVRVVDADAGTFLETRGDANEASDPALVPGDAVVGVVVGSVPLLGLLLALLGMPIGIVTILSVAGTLVTALWLLDEFEEAELTEAAAVRPAPGPLTDAPPAPRRSVP